MRSAAAPSLRPPSRGELSPKLSSATLFPQPVSAGVQEMLPKRKNCYALRITCPPCPSANHWSTATWPLRCHAATIMNTDSPSLQNAAMPPIYIRVSAHEGAVESQL